MIALTLLRYGHDAALLSLLGTSCFRAWVLPAAFAAGMESGLRCLTRASAVLALTLGVGWFLAEAAMVAEAHGVGPAIAAVPAFVAYLPFGQLLAVRLVIIAAAVFSRSATVAFVLAAAAVVEQPWFGHAGQIGAGVAASEVLHLLAGGIWFGSLVPLLLVLRGRPAGEAARVFRRFTLVGLAAVVVLAGTGIAQALVMGGGLASLAGSLYGRLVLTKVGLFGVALLVAARNGLVLTGRLAAEPTARRSLAQSVIAEMGIVAAILLVAALLAETAPGAMVKIGDLL